LVLVTVKLLVDASAKNSAPEYVFNNNCVCPAVIADIFVPALCVTVNGAVGGVNAPV
jgi:hypothetical protein